MYSYLKGGRFFVAGAATCPSQRVSPRARLWLFARQCQKAFVSGAISTARDDRAESSAAETGVSMPALQSSYGDYGLPQTNVVIGVA